MRRNPTIFGLIISIVLLMTGCHLGIQADKDKQLLLEYQKIACLREQRLIVLP